MRMLRVYHGTSSSKARSIRSKGLESPLGYQRAKWYMVAEDFASAAHHAQSMEGPGVVLEIQIPIPADLPRRKWPGWPYLWPGTALSWDGAPTKWYALREAIPPEFIKGVTPVDARRVAVAWLGRTAQREVN